MCSRLIYHHLFTILLKWGLPLASYEIQIIGPFFCKAMYIFDAKPKPIFHD